MNFPIFTFNCKEVYDMFLLVIFLVAIFYIKGYTSSTKSKILK